jgi:hypothetical protein
MCVLLLVAGADARAQTLDPEIDPFPFDARKALREYFRLRLPPFWYVDEPELHLQQYSVLVHLPDGWQGNPTSAVMNLCPSRDDPLWNGIEAFEVVPFYKRHQWTAFTCRR